MFHKDGSFDKLPHIADIYTSTYDDEFWIPINRD